MKNISKRRFRLRRKRSRSRSLFIAAGFILQAATPLTLAVGGGVLLLARGLQVWSYGHLDKATRTSAHRPPAVTTSGPYAFVRNPIMYGSALSDLGFLLMAGNPVLVALYLITMVPMHAWRVIRVEEPFLLKEYGEEYRKYLAAVPRFLPKLTPTPDRDRRRFRLGLVLWNREFSRTFSYLFLGSALVIFSGLGSSGLLPSWTELQTAAGIIFPSVEDLRRTLSQPWILIVCGSFGLMALSAGYLQKRMAKGAEVDTTRPDSQASGPPTPP
ncbi:MAG: isoprenylcysteine carboxylmethyltransferase family protein [Planctomycetota bacterium]|nr:isoprenylcysteine carboxylmethyltransferase family protein [Planctomycetota bacterium]